VRARLSLTLIALLLGGSPFAQTSSPPPALDRQWLAGTWKLDKSGPPEDEKNWRRPDRVKSDKGLPDGRGGTATTEPAPEWGKVVSLNSFGRKLIAPSEMLVLQVHPDAVTMRDDFREPTRYGGAGRSTSFEVVERYARSTGTWYVSPPRSFTVSAKSSWNGDALVQELWTRDLNEIVRITRTFIPASERREMLFVIKVLEPKLKDPVKDIERLYVRQPS
jgi:hypothetical protein